MKRFVDLALFVTPGASPIYIEIKYSNRLNNEKELENAETQLRDYNVSFTSLFTILTDGNNWRFYYTLETGSFSHKCFKTINLLNDNIDDIEKVFDTFLSKRKILSEEARKEAHELLQMSKKQRIIEESIPKAKRLILENPTLSLTGALIKILSERGITISENDAVESFKQETVISQEKPLEDRPQRIIPIAKDQIKRIDPLNPPSFDHTKVLNGLVNSIPCRNWNEFIRAAIQIIIEGGTDVDSIRTISKLNIKEGLHTTSGFCPVKNVNYSVQNISANAVIRSLSRLANHFNLKVFAEFEWRENPGAAFPGEKAILKWN
ncbi:MAG: hypothetical protein K0B37_10870 [Bacteroidales bacterium]|nr:hypothetical protein [Bacteroidales bacterium]